jgi:MobC-like protein
MKSRNLKLSIRVTRDEQAEVANLAHTLSMSVSNYGRKRLLGAAVKQTIIPPVNIETYQVLVNLKHELKAIGQNLNQVTKAMHTFQSASPALLSTIDNTSCQITQATKLLNRLQLSAIGVIVK